MIDLTDLKVRKKIKEGDTVLLKVASVDYHSPAGEVMEIGDSFLAIKPLESKELSEMQAELAEMYGNNKLNYTIFDAQDIRSISVMEKYEKTADKSSESSSGR